MDWFLYEWDLRHERVKWYDNTINFGCFFKIKFQNRAYVNANVKQTPFPLGHLFVLDQYFKCET